ncbi:polyhydroxybutyrate depolymerase [uncultured Roseobacter sp.]|uniref:alpha/beta hydrolase family esterase n=1 Tax=uncultured Roseobacter sp. TaxID=114847 RepID=UPI0026230845|nr:polyhydroxybutyrate depolymerase [uncultured Roseobacter sp.]
MRFFLILLFCTALPLILAGKAQACGEDTRCMIGDRHYYIAMPAGHDGRSRIPALIFAHGLQGTAEGTMQNPRLRRIADDLGVAFIAVKSAGVSWSQENAPRTARGDGVKALAYFDAVRKDAIRRFAIDPDRIVVSGASTGGMMTWGLACHRSGDYAGFIPMSGTFWAPVPRTCSRPVASIIHFHGDKDQTVPLEGRAVAGTRQGSVPDALEMYRQFGRFKAAKTVASADLRCQNRRNNGGDILGFCLYDGRHSFRSENIRIAWEMLRAAGRL